MFKRKDPVDLAKWAFDKGVEQENQRIRKVISEFSHTVAARRNEFEAGISKDDEKTLERKATDLHIHEEAMAILNKLTQKPWQPADDYGPAPIDTKVEA